MSENNIIISLPDIEQINRQHRLNWLKIFSVIVIIIGLGTLAIDAVLSYIYGTFNIVPILTLSILLVSGLAAYQLGKWQKLTEGSWILVGAFLVVQALLYPVVGTALPLYIGFLVPIAMSAVLLGLRSVLIVLALSIIYSVGFIVAAGFLEIIAPPTAVIRKMSLDSTSIFLVVVLFPSLVAIVGIPFRKQSQSIQQQNRQLRQLLQTLQHRYETIETVSHNVQNLSTVLKTSAYQQDASSREQVSSVHEVNDSLQELYTTAAHIALVSQQVSEAAESMNIASLQIEQISQAGVSYNQQGIGALQRTTHTTNEIAELYDNLLSVLQELTAKSSNMRQILQLLKNITNQTHLLALNASIEAAGAGAHGTRFAVVAQQVKELANNANYAREQVERDVSDIEQTTAQAVQAVMIGYDKSVKLGQVNSETQSVFSRIFESANDVQAQSDDICSVAQNVKDLTETVRLATNQQRSATEQILNILANLNVIAQQNAASSQQVTSTVQQLEEMSEQLIYSLAA